MRARVIVCMLVCMDAWMRGGMDAWMHGCMDAWMHAAAIDERRETGVISNFQYILAYF